MAEIGRRTGSLYYLVELSYMDFWHGGYGVPII
jgi:hypothetical protein